MSVTKVQLVGNVSAGASFAGDVTFSSISVGVGTSAVVIDGTTGIISATSITIGTQTVSSPGVGINTAGGTVGTGATVLDFRGSGISTITVASGIATINITGGTSGGSSSITVQDEGSNVGTAATIFNFVGSGVTASYSSGIATITISGGVSGTNYWEQTSVGINTLSNVGIGTTNPTSKLTVSGDTNIIGGLNVSGITTLGVTSTTNLTSQQLNVSGITTLAGNVNLGDNTADDINVSGEFISNLIPNATNTYDLGSSTQRWKDLWIAGTVTGNSFSGSGTNLTGIVTSITAGSGISVNSNTGNVTITGVGTQWVTTAAGIHTLSNVGIGTTNPTSKLTVSGNTNISGVITATTVNDSIGNVRAIPQNAQTSAYILAASDVGKHISITTGGVTVNASIFSVGDVVSIYNNSTSNQTITQGTSVTMYLGGTATTGNRTLAQRGIATVLCVVGGATPTFVISGSGLT